LTAIARQFYAAMLRHPWLPFQTGRQPRFGPSATRVTKQAAQATSSLSLEEDEVWTLHGTVNDYVLGHAIRAVTASKPEDLEDMIPEKDLADAPELASLPKYLRSRASLERFETGLQIVLDGIERRLRAVDGPAGAGRPET
jgi:hypothetical protein